MISYSVIFFRLLGSYYYLYIHMTLIKTVYVQNSPAPPIPRLRQFKLSPASVANAGERARLPRFSVTGHLDSDTWQLDAPLTGEVSYLDSVTWQLAALLTGNLLLHLLARCVIWRVTHCFNT